MPVEFGEVLHVLAHELRTPVGIAHGYLRLLLDNRLTADTDRHRALEQMQKALARVSALSHETTALATWYERERAKTRAVSARAIIDQLTRTDYEEAVVFEPAPIADTAMLDTTDLEALTDALTTVIRATARELRGVPCAVRTAIHGGQLDVLTGTPERLDLLAAGPGADGAEALAVERGGLGLALVHAALVLDAHGAQRWSAAGSRQTAGVRLPLLERQHS